MLKVWTYIDYDKVLLSVSLKPNSLQKFKVKENNQLSACDPSDTSCNTFYVIWESSVS